MGCLEVLEPPLLRGSSSGSTPALPPFRYNADMNFSTLFFDLDATLYPGSSGLWQALKSRIHRFMEQQLGLPKEEIDPLRQQYYQQYGTTLSGLMRHHQVDPQEYLTYVHDIDLENYISYSPRLKEILSSLPQSLWVFTNADRPHAERVLKILQLEKTFTGIVDIHALDFLVKPEPGAYRRALALAGLESPAGCVLFDDLSQNLPPANRMGFFTVLVNEKSITNQADLHISSLHDLPQRMPYLW